MSNASLTCLSVLDFGFNESDPVANKVPRAIVLKRPMSTLTGSLSGTIALLKQLKLALQTPANGDFLKSLFLCLVRLTWQPLYEICSNITFAEPVGH